MRSLNQGFKLVGCNLRCGKFHRMSYSLTVSAMQIEHIEWTVILASAELEEGWDSIITDEQEQDHQLGSPVHTLRMNLNELSK